MPKISIIVAAYNVEKYICRCLNSLVNQTLDNIEIIVVNDGSTDDTLNKIKEFVQDHRVKIIDKKNGGLIEARKSGLNVTTGEYVQFVDGDDWLRQDACEILYKKAVAENLDIVYFNLNYVYGDEVILNSTLQFDLLIGQKYLDMVLRNEIRANIVLQLIKKSFIKNNNIEIPGGITYAEDLLITVILASYNPRVSMIGEGLYYYYQRDGSITRMITNRVFDVEKVINLIGIILEKNKFQYKYSEQFDYLSYMHLYFYRIIEAEYIEKLHYELYCMWKKRNIDIKRNVYYKNHYNKLSFKTKIKLKAYNISFTLGKYLTNSIYTIKNKTRKVR